MNASVQTVYVGSSAPATRFDDLDRVSLVRNAVSDEGVEIPVGSTGTIVATWAEGAAYEVEFARPFHALATVRVEDLEPASR